MATTVPTPTSYTLEQAEQEIADLRNQLTLMQTMISTVSDKALLLYAPDQHAIPRGPTKWSFEDGTTQSWNATNGAITNSVVTATGWPTDGTHSLLLTCNGGANPLAYSPYALNAIPTQPGDPIVIQVDVYVPASLTNVYAAIGFLDDTGGYISQVNSTQVNMSAGQVNTFYVNGTAPDLCAFFYVIFGTFSTPANGTLIYGDNIRVQGNLAISASPGGGTDPVGNPYDSGFEVQLEQQGAVRVKGVSGQVIVMKIVGGAPLLALQTGAPEEGIAANYQAFLFNPGASEQMVSFLVGPSGSVHKALTSVLLASDAKDDSVGAYGALNWSDNSGNEHFWGRWDANGLKIFSPISGDTTKYQGERNTADMINNVVVNSSTAIQFLNSISVGVGHYRVNGQVIITPTVTGGTAQFQFSSGAGSAAYMGIQFTEIEFANPAAVGNAAIATAFASVYNSATLNVTNQRVYTFSGQISMSVAGTFGIFASTNGVGSFTINRTGTWMELAPIGP